MKKNIIQNVIFNLFLGLIFFSLVFPGNLQAKKEKPGALVLVTKTDGSRIEGELLMVKETSILLAIHSGVTGEEINVNDIEKVKIKKRSKFLSGLGIGLISGAIIGGLMGYAEGDDTSGWLQWSASTKATLGAIGLGFLGGIGGGVTGVILGIDELVNLKTKSPDKVEELLKKLKKYARVKK